MDKGETDAVMTLARKHFPDAGEREETKEHEAADVAPQEPRARPQLGEGLLVRDVMTREVKTLSSIDRLSCRAFGCSGKGASTMIRPPSLAFNC